MQSDVLILGAGAAGLFCAMQAGRRGLRVTLLEHQQRAGRKILISGGGRCNFTNRDTRAENFLSRNSHFAKSALARYTPQDFVALVDKHRIPWHEKKLGQLFCTRAASDITTMLESECAQAGVDLRVNHRVSAVRRDLDAFLVETPQGEFRAARLVVATGGLSIPKIGATGLAYDIAGQFGLRIIPPRPALVPLLWPGWSELSGVSTSCVAGIGKRSFAEKLLFTHRGLSGPAILQISSYWSPGQTIHLNLLPEGEDGEPLPSRLARRLRGSEAPLSAFPVVPTGTEGYEKAEVTAGGIDTNELSSKTMESRSVPGLFFIGEAVDVTGWLGGYNFQWAWSSAFAAANA